MTLLRRLGLFAMGFSLPIQGISLLTMGGQTVIGRAGATPFKFVTLAVFMFAALEAVAYKRFPRIDKTGLCVIGYAVSFSLSSVLSTYYGVSSAAIVSATTTTFALCAFFFLLTFLLRDRKDMTVMLWGLALGGLITAAPSVLGLQDPSAYLEVGERHQGLAGQENLFGFDMAVCLPTSLAVFVLTRSLLLKPLALLCAVFALAGVALSFSRSAYVSIAVMSLMGFFFVIRKGSSRVIALAFGVALLVGAISHPGIRDRVESFVDPAERAADSSIASRFDQYEFALRAFASNPVLGIGPLRFIQWAQGERGGERIGHFVHNSYLAILSRQGLIGIVPYVALLWMVWFRYSRAISMMREDRKQRLAFSLLHLAFLGTLVGSLFGMGYRSKTMWFLVAMGVIVHRLAVVAQAKQHGDVAGTRAYPPPGLQTGQTTTYPRPGTSTL